jgi:hypothetical protein
MDSSEPPPLDRLLVPSILTDLPVRFDRPWNPIWIIWVGLMGGPLFSALISSLNRERLDLRGYSAFYLPFGMCFQFITVIVSIEISSELGKRPDILLGAIVIFFLGYLFNLVFALVCMRAQTSRYQVYRSMGLPDGSPSLPVICFWAGVLGTGLIVLLGMSVRGL